MTREELLNYLPLVKSIAKKYKIFAPSNVDFEDLVHWGIIGLLEAEKNYSISKGSKFTTYAYIKIKGSIIDNLRKLYPLPPHIIKQVNKIIKKIGELEEKLGRSPTEEEIAESLNYSLKKYRDILNKINVFHIISNEEIEKGNSKFYSSLSGNHKEEVIEILSLGIERLTELEKLVLSLYYKEERTLKEIGIILNLTEARISQIHKQIILKLKSYISKYYEKSKSLRQ
ncbi:MAG: FliA/WhiG family RNA polymerase sigma factor [bacterium]|nr:FliA/WhiG family RNA polymerase sigma factor [bacterium]MDW8163677.1 FliA/WhiG family RNA polymerase sigma factor [Candidatus Omnitrophota bacterium]